MPRLTDTALANLQRMQRIEAERDRAHGQMETAAVLLYAAAYVRDAVTLHDCIRGALSALGYDADDEGPLSLHINALIANDFYRTRED